MGWWRIDPDTGKPADARSKLSRTPEFTLLNAVPGVDDDEASHFPGDGPWDMAASGVDKLRELLGDSLRLSDDEARRLFGQPILPDAMQGWPEETRRRVLNLVEEMWADIDWRVNP